MEERGREPASLDFGALLRRYRLAAGLSQGALAERARLSLYGVSALERGYRRTPQRETVGLLAGALALSDEQRTAFEAAAARPTSSRASGDTSVAVGPWPTEAAVTLPLALTRFIGREAQLAEIATLMHQHRLVTVTGAGGIGKTQVALRTAAAFGGHSKRVIQFVTLASIEEPSSVVTAIASDLGVQEVPDRPLLETLVASLKNKTTLLVLDNCEHAIEQTAVISQTLLTACPHLHILATSREPLRVAGERTYRLPSLDANDAIALFVDRAQATDAHFRMNEEIRSAIAAICKRLDGIPLAIELAAARVNVLTPTAIVKGLDDCFGTLGSGERTALPRQRTMRAAIDWSYGLLTTTEQRLLERLSIFANGCTLEAAVSVCADDHVVEAELLGLLSSLVEKSLVMVDHSGATTRYQLLEPFRQYAREKLTARGEYDIMASRWAASLLTVAQRLGAEWDSAAEPAWYDVVREETADWRAVLEWTLGRRGDIPTGQRLVGALQRLRANSPAVEWRRWITVARDLAGPSTPDETLAALSYAECSLADVLGQQQLELASAMDSLSRYRALDDELGIVRSEFHVARAFFSLGRHSLGEPIALDAIARARRLGLRKTLAVVLLELARSYREREDVPLARRCIAEARAILLNVGAILRARLVEEELGLCELYEGRPEVAAQLMLEALSVYRAVGDMRGAVTTLTLRAQCLRCAGDFNGAEACAREALDISAEQRYSVGIAGAIQRLVAIALFRGLPKFGLPIAVCERSARLVGFIDAALVANGSPRFPHDTEEYEAALQLMRAGIGEGKTEQLMRNGAGTGEDEAIEEALKL